MSLLPVRGRRQGPPGASHADDPPTLNDGGRILRPLHHVDAGQCRGDRLKATTGAADVAE